MFVDALESGYFEAPDAVLSGDTVTVASGGAFDTGTYTASETVTSGQALSGVNADLTVPEQMTFTLGSNASSISFSIPWSSVDPTEASQSIALTDFNITIGSQTFYQATTSFTTSPSIQFAYGQMQGITFAFDPSGSPYESVSMSGGMGVTAYTASFPHTEVTTVAATSSGSFTIDFSKFGQFGPGTTTYVVGKGTISFVVTTTTGVKYSGSVSFGITTQLGVAELVEAELVDQGLLKTTVSTNNNSVILKCTGNSGETISTVTVTTETGGQKPGENGSPTGGETTGITYTINGKEQK